MSYERFKRYIPSPETRDAYEAEVEFRQWCGEQEPKLDPQDEDARESYAEIQRESRWDNMDPDDQAGWMDNMTKD
jgi:hypothetical protein